MLAIGVYGYSYEILAFPSSLLISSNSVIPLTPFADFLTIFFPKTLYPPKNSSMILSNSLDSLNSFPRRTGGNSEITDSSSSSLYVSRIYPLDRVLATYTPENRSWGTGDSGGGTLSNRSSKV